MNTAGFYGYSIASVYPNMGNGVTQTQETTPESDDQQVYTQVDGPAAQPGVDKGTKMNMFILLAGMIGIIVLFSKQ